MVNPFHRKHAHIQMTVQMRDCVCIFLSLIGIANSQAAIDVRTLPLTERCSPFSYEVFKGASSGLQVVDAIKHSVVLEHFRLFRTEQPHDSEGPTILGSE